MKERDRELLKQKVSFIPAGEFEQPGLVAAMRMENGNLIMVNSYKHDAEVSGATLAIYARMLNADQVVIHGKWVFVPDTEDDSVVE